MAMTITVNWIVIAGLAVWTALVFWLGRSSGNREGRDLLGPPSQMVTPRPSPPPGMSRATAPSEGLSPGRLEAIRGALAAGNRIMAIKLYREATGVGLAEAKAAVEAMDR